MKKNFIDRERMFYQNHRNLLVLKTVVDASSTVIFGAFTFAQLSSGRVDLALLCGTAAGYSAINTTREVFLLQDLSVRQ